MSEWNFTDLVEKAGFNPSMCLIADKEATHFGYEFGDRRDITFQKFISVYEIENAKDRLSYVKNWLIVWNDVLRDEMRAIRKSERK